MPEPFPGDDQTAYERAMADQGLLARFVAMYEGPARPEDALWWIDHPHESGPSGASSPAALAEAARHDLYGPGRGDQTRYRAALAHATAAREHAERAFAAATGERPDPDLDPADPTRPPTKRWGRRNVWGLVLLGAAVVAAVVVLTLALASGRDGRPSGATATPGGFSRVLTPTGPDGALAASLLPRPPVVAGATLLETATSWGSGAQQFRPIRAEGTALVIAATCVGSGSLDVTLSNGASAHFPCGPARGTTRARHLPVPTHLFLFSVAPTRSAAWSLAVAVVPRG